MKSSIQDQIKLVFLKIKPHNIVFCGTTPIDYEMYCSCYGFDETELYTITYTRDELKKLANTSK